MGRAKREVKRIECTESRRVTYSKRRNGLIKKAYELSTLCGVDVALLTFSSAGKIHHFSAPSRFEDVLKRYLSQSNQPSGSSNLTPQQKDHLMVLLDNIQHVENQAAEEILTGSSDQDVNQQLIKTQERLVNMKRNLRFLYGDEQNGQMTSLFNYDREIKKMLAQVQRRKEYIQWSRSSSQPPTEMTQPQQNMQDLSVQTQPQQNMQDLSVQTQPQQNMRDLSVQTQPQQYMQELSVQTQPQQNMQDLSMQDLSVQTQPQQNMHDLSVQTQPQQYMQALSVHTQPQQNMQELPYAQNNPGSLPHHDYDFSLDDFEFLSENGYLDNLQAEKETEPPVMSSQADALAPSGFNNSYSSWNSSNLSMERFNPSWPFSG